MPLFSISNVNFKKILKYPFIDIKENTVTFICGRSGTGKSTLLKLLNASVSPDSGEILYQGKPIDHYDTIMLRREVLLVSQNTYLFEGTIENNFEEFYRYRELNPPHSDIIHRFLKICLADFPANANCYEMSGGERQRVFIGICLSFMPKVLMLDEPTSALDEQTSKVLMQNLKDYCKENKITLIVINHNRLLTEQYADEMISLDDCGKDALKEGDFYE